MSNPSPTPLTPSPDTLARRLLSALLPTLALVFTVLVFGPLEIFALNADTLIFRLGEFLPALLGLSLAAWAALLLPALLLRGKAWRLYLTVVFAAALCAYLQAVLLNPDLGTLDGRQVDWAAMGDMRANAAIWAAVLAASVLLCLLAWRLWRGVLRFAPIILVGMQLVSLVGSYTTKQFPIITDAYLSNDTLFELSDDENVVVFILDGFDNQAMARLMDTGPEYLKAFDGFTYHPDTASLYGRTFPAVTYLNTAVRDPFTEPNHVYMQRAFAEGTFLPDLRALGYGVQIFAPAYSFAGDASVLEGVVDNIAYAPRQVDGPGLVSRLWRLSAYRYAPLALKPSLWVASNDFSDLVQHQNAEAFGGYVGDMGDNVYHISDLAFYQRLQNEGLRTQSDHKTYTFYHLQGVHPPFDMDETGRQLPADEYGNEARQARAEMLMLQEYFDQMKALDIFTYSTIIVTADHGYFWGKMLEAETERKTTSPIFFVKLSGEGDDEPLKISDAPLSHVDFHPTIMDAVGGDPNRYPEGIPAYAVGEGEERVRQYIQTYNNTVATYGIDGPVSDPDNWFVMDKFETDYPFY